jgi:Sulfotransferase family
MLFQGKKMHQKYLFICGCPRSGTTALVRLLNSHNSLAIGMERYKYYASSKNISRINQEAFKSDTFLNLQADQTNINWKYFYDELIDKYQSRVKYLGDKYPHYYRFYQQINQNLGNVKWIFIIRDVVSIANSYNARAADPNDQWSKEANFKRAVEHWNESLVSTWKYQKNNPNPQLFVCEYERLFNYDLDYLNSMLDFLEVEPDPQTEAFFTEMKQAWLDHKVAKPPSSLKLNEMELQYINEHANFALKDSLLKKFSRPPLVKVS